MNEQLPFPLLCFAHCPKLSTSTPFTQDNCASLAGLAMAGCWALGVLVALYTVKSAVAGPPWLPDRLRFDGCAFQVVQFVDGRSCGLHHRESTGVRELCRKEQGRVGVET